jgi:hypothetical protein
MPTSTANDVRQYLWMSLLCVADALRLTGLLNLQSGTMVAPHIHGLRTDDEFSNFLRDTKQKTVGVPLGAARALMGVANALLRGAGARRVWIQLVSCSIQPM